MIACKAPPRKHIRWHAWWGKLFKSINKFYDLTTPSGKGGTAQGGTCSAHFILGKTSKVGCSSILTVFSSPTAWVGSIAQFSLFFFCYPGSLLSERYGCRRVVIVGGILTSIGLLLSSFATSLNQIYFTHGIIVGFGTSISYLPALVMVAYYFDKKRSFATGIATSGSNLGALGLAPLQQVIVDAFGWRNCYRFLSGLALVITVCGLLFKPLDEKKTGEDRLVKSSEIIFETSFKKKLLSFPRNNWFIIWAVASTIATFGYFIPHVHLVSVQRKWWLFQNLYAQVITEILLLWLVEDCIISRYN